MKKFNNWNWLDSIQKLYDQQNYEKALKFIIEYMNDYPNSVNAKHLYVKTLMKLHRVDEVQDYLENNDTYICNNKFYLFRIALLKNDYKTAYKLLPDVIEESKQYEKPFEGLYASRIFLEKKLGILDENIDFDSLTYSEQQIIEYDEQRALEHIKRHQQECSSKRVHTLFEPELDLEKLFYQIREKIVNQMSYCQLLMDNYIFEYPEVNSRIEKDGYLYKYIHVVIIKDTTDIITMYPLFTNRKLKEAISLEEEIEKVKIPTQIEKFNRKYKFD